MNYQYKDVRKLRQDNVYLEYYLRAAKVVERLETEFGIEDQLILDIIYYDIFTMLVEGKDNYEQIAIDIYNSMKGDNEDV